MPRDTMTMTVSLPPEMVRQVNDATKREHRTRSELVREALRTYFTVGRVFPTYTPTAGERRAIEKGRAAIRSGQYYTLDEFRAYLGGQSQKTRAKKRRARTSS